MPTLFKSFTVFSTRRFECRFYQDFSNLTLSIGINWSKYEQGKLFHLRLIFWEIDIEHFPKNPAKEIHDDFTKTITDILNKHEPKI